MSEPLPLLALSGVTVRYGTLAALRDVDVQIRRGEFVALVGSNGAGKTTLLHALHGLLPHTGTRRVAETGATQAMVFQRPFMLRLSVLNNLRIALWLANVPKAERAGRAREALQRSALADRAERPARTLSGGQQQRLALARAWAVRPDILFLDEPTSNLDPAAKKEIEAMLAAFAADGMTLVMSTHNLGQAKRLATRMIHLDGGTIRADLPTERYFSEHADLPLRGDPAAIQSPEESS
jgi:tungstate transport system ATP-binding protein